MNALMAVLLGAIITGVVSEEWPRFRGPNGSGVAADLPVPARFGPDTNVIWKTDVPPGHSSPVVGGNHVFVTAADGDALLTLALDRRTGRLVWTAHARRTHRLRVDSRNHPASPSPVTDGSNVYVFFQDFGLVS